MGAIIIGCIVVTLGFGAAWCFFSLLAYAWNEVVVGKFWQQGPILDWWHVLIGGILIAWFFRMIRR